MKAPEVLNFRLTESDAEVLVFLMTRTGITSSAQIVRLALRELAQARGLSDKEGARDAS